MGDEGPEGEGSRAYYTSALHPKHSQQPTTRRRHSGSVNGSSSSGSRLSSRHGRSRTDSNGGRSKDSHYDPLTPIQNGFSGSAAVTRPYLTSTINNIGGEFTSDEGTDSETTTHKEEESVVVVHQITSTDSLAGVSLKYGISLSDLRRANHLWVNDPIHLRKELYIPVDKSLRARELIQEIQFNSAPLIDLSPSSSSQTSDATADNELPASLNTPVGTGVDLQRVPTSRLSFFPPPSTSGKMPSISSTQPPLPSTNLKFLSSNSRHSTSSPLLSLLTALPIPASTRDDLFARLSFDSNSSSFSDRSRPSLEEHLEGHELDVISNRNESNYDRIGGSTPSRACTPKATYHKPPALTTRASKSSPRNTRPHRLSSTPPASYIPQIPDRTTIRTVQMEPSPIMQLPVLHSRKPRSLALYGSSNGVANAASNVFELQGSTSIPQR